MTHQKLLAAEEAMKKGDYKPLIAIGMRAAASGWKGERCRCAKPEVVGLDLMCRACLLESESQMERRVAALRAPHDFVPKKDQKLDVGMCAFCSGWRNDPRHGEPVEENLSAKAQQVRAIVDAVFDKRSNRVSRD